MLSNADFSLSDESLERLNKYVSDAAIKRAQATDEPGTELSVSFTFTPLGRFVDVQFSGGTIFELET